MNIKYIICNMSTIVKETLSSKPLPSIVLLINIALLTMSESQEFIIAL